MLRDMIMDAITSDPDYKNGNYDHPIHGLRAAQDGLIGDDVESAGDAEAVADSG